MGHVFHLIASHPLVITIVGLSLLLVAGLLLSDWTEKRRERQLLLARARLRGGNPDPALNEALRQNRPVARLFRWEFLFLSLALTGLLTPDDTWRVSARNAVSTPMPAPADPAVESSLQLSSLSLALPAEIAAAAGTLEFNPGAHAPEQAVFDLTFLTPEDPDDERLPQSSIPDVRTSFRPWSPM